MSKCISWRQHAYRFAVILLIVAVTHVVVIAVARVPLFVRASEHIEFGSNGLAIRMCWARTGPAAIDWNVLGSAFRMEFRTDPVFIQIPVWVILLALMAVTAFLRLSLRRNGGADDASGNVRVVTRSILWAIVIAILGLVIALSTSRLTLLTDDPFSGVKYRGVPFAFLKFSAKWEPVQAWRVEWGGLALDTFVWMLPAILIIFLRHVYREERSRKWAMEGRCTRCGYDLRGSGSGRCSECGLQREQKGGRVAHLVSRWGKR